MEKKEFELLAPAGSPDIFRAVIEAGADAVYVGGNRFGARAYANNFSTEELLQAIDYAHLRGRKVYLTVNTLLKNEELEQELYDYLLPFYKQGLDAVLVQDFGVLQYVHQYFPDLPIHTSTQMTVTGVDGVRLLQQYGVTRVVMAREVSLKEMQNIYEQTGMELEAFVHGALCYCYSGQCLFSSMLGGRSGNRGRCAQPCRLSYSVLDRNHKEYMSDSYILSLKDMCGIEDLPQLHQSGVYSLKIEGRMKQAAYAAGVVSYYRRYIDRYMSKIATHDSQSADSFSIDKKDKQGILDLGNRCGFTDLYYHRHNGKEMVTYEKPNYVKQNETFQEEILERYTKNRHPLPITGKALLHLGRNAELSVGQGECQVTIQGPMVDAAQKAPVTAEDIKKRLSKTGDTPFCFEELEVEADDGIFLPNGALNQIRRDALEALKNSLLCSYKRQGNAWDRKRQETPEKIANEQEKNAIHDIQPEEPIKHIISISERRQLPVVLEYAKMIHAIYLDTVMYDRKNFVQELSKDMEEIRYVDPKADIEIYLMLPAIFRQGTSHFYDSQIENIRKFALKGFVVRTYEELYWVHSHFQDAEIVTDHNLYVYNDWAKYGFHLEGMTRDTVPLELNRMEIMHRNNKGSQMILYGYYPLMVSAQCVHRNSLSCDKQQTITYLRDRYKKKFPVRNYCSECYNVIYNSLPTMLFSHQGELSRFGIREFRLHFTVEGAREVRRVMSAYVECAVQGNQQTKLSGEYTNGHYKRGVE